MYNTGNPIPSAALEDMADNAQVFDALVTQTEGTVTDRLGVPRRVFQQIIMDMGFQPLAGSFQTGATITARNQTLYDEVSQVFYAWGGAIPVGGYIVPAGSTPSSAGGVGAGAWSDKTDLMLRTDLLSGPITTRNSKLALKYTIHASDYGVVDDYYTITPTILATLIGGVTGYSYAIGINPTPTDNANAIQKAVNELPPGGVLSFAGLRGVGISRTIVSLTGRTSIISDNKNMSQILPISGFVGTCLVQFGDGTQAYQKTSGIGYIAAVAAGANVSGIEVDNFYNFEATDIKAQSGDFTTRECAGIDIISGIHTKIESCNLHNSFCYGMIIRAHQNGLKIYHNAFDESDVSIISKGNIVDVTMHGNEYGSARANPSNPAPINGVHVDLRVGTHGTVKINDTFIGGGGTKFHVRYNAVSRIDIDGSFNNASRFAIAGNGSTTSVATIKGIYAGNGTDTGTTDPTLGTTNPDTTTYCCDIHLAKAYLKPTEISIASSSTNTPAWIEGTSAALSTSNVSLVNCSSLSANTAYIHGVLITNKMLLQNGSRLLCADNFTVTARTVTRGTAQTGVVSFSGAVVGDTAIASFKDIPASYNLVISAVVSGNNLVRWVIVNTSDTAVVIPDTVISIAINKLK